MDNIQWFDILWAVIIAGFIWKMIPAAKHWIKNGPKGTSKEWLTTAMLLGGVVVFVFFLISLVRT